MRLFWVVECLFDPDWYCGAQKNKIAASHLQSLTRWGESR